MTCKTLHLILYSSANALHSQGEGEDDLWDFGTVRHTATIGRAQAGQAVDLGPDGNIKVGNGSSRDYAYDLQDRGNSSAASSSMTVKPDQPTSTTRSSKSNKSDEYEGTIRRSAPPTARGQIREPSDDYEDDYDRDYQSYNDAPPASDDDLPDSTMLDSVVLPAIASVRAVPIRYLRCICLSSTFTAVPPSLHTGSSNCAQQPPEGVHRGRACDPRCHSRTRE
jgi:hypothetical protein